MRGFMHLPFTIQTHPTAQWQTYALSKFDISQKWTEISSF